MNIDMVVLFQLLVVVLAWSISQLIKGVLGHLTFSRKSFFSTSGGMPSSHTASASAFFFAEVLFNGLTSLGVLALLFLVVIIVDAMGVRYATGVNAQVLHDSINDKKLQKNIILKKGHKKIEVLAGFVLGLLIAIIVFLIV